MTVLLDVRHSVTRQCNPEIMIRWTGQGDQQGTLERKSAYRPEPGKAIDSAFTGRQQLDQDHDSGVSQLWITACNGADKTDITDKRAVLCDRVLKRINNIGINGYLKEYDSS